MMQAKYPQGKTLPQDYLLRLRPVSLMYDTIKGHTPTMFATTLTRSGIDRLFVMMALRNAGREAIQSRVSAPFNRFTTKSVKENGSRRQGSQRQAKQCAEGNASTAADRMWGIQ